MHTLLQWQVELLILKNKVKLKKICVYLCVFVCVRVCVCVCVCTKTTTNYLIFDIICPSIACVADSLSHGQQSMIL